MDNVSGSMKSLCDDIITTSEERKNDLDCFKDQVESIRNDARKFLSDCRKFHKEMSKDLKKSLQQSRNDLIKNVNVLREGFVEKEKEVKADLAEASRIWTNLGKTLRSKPR